MTKRLLSLATLCVLGLSIHAQDVLMVEGNPSTTNAIQFNKFSYLDGKTIFQKSDELKTDFSKDYYEKSVNNSPVSPLIAATALDTKHNAMVYLPMLSQAVYVYDLQSETLSKIDIGKSVTCTCTEANLFNRMTTASNGKIYALNNDGSSLLEVDVALKSVTNLGSIQENPDFKDRMKAWGGDMIASNDGSLYIISAMANVYQLDMETKKATFLGKIKGLPDNYSTNGVAVLENGSVLLANSNGKEMYSFDMETLTASYYSEAKAPIYDLASKYLLGKSEAEQLQSDFYSLYPTQITSKQIQILQNTKETTKVHVVVYDLYNQVVYQQKNVALASGEAKSIQMTSLKPGIYIVKVIDANGVEQLNEKVTVSK